MARKLHRLTSVLRTFFSVNCSDCQSPGETRQKLIDFRKNALDMRKKRDVEAPSRTSTLHLINEAKKHENALADMAYGEKKLRDESSSVQIVVALSSLKF